MLLAALLALAGLAAAAQPPQAQATPAQQAAEAQEAAEAFDRAVDAVAAASRQLLDDLVTTAPPKSREVEAAKKRARWVERQAQAV